MSSSNPRQRLSRLFRSRDSPPEQDHTTVSSAAFVPPDAPFNRRHVRKSRRRTSLRDFAQGLGNSVAGSVSTTSRGIRNSTEVKPSPNEQQAAQAAAIKALYPEQDMVLPHVAYESDLSASLRDLTVSDNSHVNDQRPKSEQPNAADLERNPRKLEIRQTNTDRPGPPPTIGNARPLLPTDPRSENVADLNIERNHAARPVIGSVKPLDPANRYSEDVADWNVVQNQKPVLGNLDDFPPPLKVKAKAPVGSRADSLGSLTSPASSSHGHGVPHMAKYADPRQSQEASHSTSPTLADGTPRKSSERRRIPRSSFQKPLPAAPSGKAKVEGVESRKQHATQTEPGQPNANLVNKSARPVDLTGVIDLSNTTDTTVHEKWAQAVTHETVTRDVHEIREERVTREIHNHHIFHRILPIVDIEVLPARHFIPVEGGYAEISESEAGASARAKAQWVVAETVSKMTPASTEQPFPREFSARKFEGAEGDHIEYTTPEGFKRTETWWVHPPTIEPGAMRSGQTYPFYFDSPDPEQDGLRANVPPGKVVGVSGLFANQQRERMEEQKARMESEPDGRSGERPET